MLLMLCFKIRLSGPHFYANNKETTVEIYKLKRGGHPAKTKERNHEVVVKDERT